MSETGDTSPVKDKEFFRQDFTGATEWDVFNARLEKIICEWKLKDVKFSGHKLEENELSLSQWERQNEFVKYSDLELCIRRHHTAGKPKEKNQLSNESNEPTSSESIEINKSSNKCQAFVDVMTLTNNWSILEENDNETIHPLTRWFSLRDFVTISVLNRAPTDIEHRTLLSSAYTEIGETGTEVPFFVQSQRPHLHVYSGNLIEYVLCLQEKLD